MPTPDEQFPGNIVAILVDALADVDGVDNVQSRPVRPVDPSGTIGVSVVDWIPKVMEIGHSDPAIARYNFKIETLIKNTDEAEGRAIHAAFAKSIRTMLYRDNTLRVRLGVATETVEGVTERTMRFGIDRQRFASNPVDKKFYFASTTDLWLETETI